LPEADAAASRRTSRRRAQIDAVNRIGHAHAPYVCAMLGVCRSARILA
jgi:hypothetical protein